MNRRIAILGCSLMRRERAQKWRIMQKYVPLGGVSLGSGHDLEISTPRMTFPADNDAPGGMRERIFSQFALRRHHASGRVGRPYTLVFVRRRD